MNHEKIDVGRSRARKRLVFVRSVWESIDECITNVMLIVGIGFVFGGFSTLVVYNGIIPSTASCLPLMLLFSLLGAIRIYTMNRLKSVELDYEQAESMELIRKVADSLQWKIDYSAKDWVALIPNHTITFSWGFHLFVITDPLNNRLMYKSVAYGRGDLQSPFHLWGNYKYEKQFREAVKTLQEAKQ